MTCPCALALATPVALAVSAGRFIDLGVLPLRMRALDALARSDLFVFDKTGTLTTGQPAIAAVVPTAGLDEQTPVCAMRPRSRPSRRTRWRMPCVTSLCCRKWLPRRW